MPYVLEVIPVPPESGGANVEGGGAYPLKYLVLFDVIHADHTLAITATDGIESVPAYGAQHPSDASCYVVDKQGVPDEESPEWWHVTVYYKVPTVSPNPQESPDAPSTGSTASPTQTPIQNDKQSFKFFRKVVAADKDYLGSDIRNSAGDPYDPPATKELFQCEFTIVRTQSTFSAKWALDYMNARNSDAFEFAGITWAKWTLCIVDIEESWPVGQGGTGHQVKIVIRADDVDFHDLVLLDAGYRKLVAGVATLITEDCGTPITQPRRLDGAGALRAAAAANVFNSYRMGPRLDFRNLQLSWRA